MAQYLAYPFAHSTAALPQPEAAHLGGSHVRYKVLGALGTVVFVYTRAGGATAAEKEHVAAVVVRDFNCPAS